MDYVLHKFEVALKEVCLPDIAENYEYEKHTDELNFCVDALLSMSED